jgi:N-acetyl-anhydromuramyl-L-alanine amidase AmpD
MAYKGTFIPGTSTARRAQMEAYVRRRNPSPPAVSEIYLRLGTKLGIRGDLAYAQALQETNYFLYGGAVRPEQNNYCGLTGASFATPEEGVLAHLQHLYAYATTAPLPVGMAKVDPRFDLVKRGSALFVGDLNGRWAVPGATYGQTIDELLGEMLMEAVTQEPYQITQAYLDPTSQNRPGICTSSYCWEGVRGIVVHRTGDYNAGAMAIRNYFNNAPDGRYASSQFVLDDTQILQLMPIGEVAYHTAGKNATTIGIETCEYNWGTSTWPETYRKLVWLTAHLMKAFQLNISQVSGHFWWDPVNRPYDPCHLGWTPAEGQPRGIFEWNQFVTDVAAEAARIIVPIQVTKTETVDCTDGLLIGSTTYVPVRPYTQCVAPDATITWDGEGPRVIVELPG